DLFRSPAIAGRGGFLTTAILMSKTSQSRNGSRRDNFFFTQSMIGARAMGLGRAPPIFRALLICKLFLLCAAWRWTPPRGLGLDCFCAARRHTARRLCRCESRSAPPPPLKKNKKRRQRCPKARK